MGGETAHWVHKSTDWNRQYDPSIVCALATTNVSLHMPTYNIYIYIYNYWQCETAGLNPENFCDRLRDHLDK